MCNIDEPFPIFGAKYNFHLEGVVDCPEFLVYFPALVKYVNTKLFKLYNYIYPCYTFRLAKIYGMELKMKMPFAEYFKSRSKLDMNFLDRIKALEVFYYNNYNIFR